MQKETYLSESLKKGRLMRWTIMPLKVYIAPMKFYAMQGEDYKYRQMVMRALEAWQKISAGAITFGLVDTLLDSNINVDWKRVDRKALGYCHFSYDAQNRLFGAEVQIGLSDGLLHAEYMSENEVYHTILHEIGHALGLGHSPYKSDIMYTPHQYGITNLSKNDCMTLKWLYKLPQGASVSEISSKYGIPSNNIDEIVTKLIMKNEPSEFEKIKNSISPQKDLLQESTNIADLKKYNIALQNVGLSDKFKKYLNNPMNNK